MIACKRMMLRPRAKGGFGVYQRSRPQYPPIVFVMPFMLMQVSSLFFNLSQTKHLFLSSDISAEIFDNFFPFVFFFFFFFLPFPIFPQC